MYYKELSKTYICCFLFINNCLLATAEGNNMFGIYLSAHFYHVIFKDLNKTHNTK